MPFHRASGVSEPANTRLRRENPCVSMRNEHYVDSAARRFRVLRIATWLAAVVSAVFGLWEIFSSFGIASIAAFNLVAALLFLTIPLLWRFSDLLTTLAFVAVAYGTVLFTSWTVGTGTGLQLYLLAAVTIVVLVLGIERIALAGVLAVLGAVLVVVLELNVPNNTGVHPAWTLTVAFISSAVSAALMAFATIWYALRETARAEHAMELEYERSEQLLANILPASVAARLKDPDHGMIADAYDDASVLVADIAGFTQRASETKPCDLVRFLDNLYTEFDRLVDSHGLEKVKTTGDSYMVISGVPEPRPDHLQALAALALDMGAAIVGLRDPAGRRVPIRIGMAAGPVVAGVVGARRFFYDVWGDAVNVASRMESTDQEGRIQVPDAVYQRLHPDFILEDRGDIDVKGKGVMHTWFLVGQRNGRSPERDRTAQSGTGRFESSTAS